jgi:hypothetical protein
MSFVNGNKKFIERIGEDYEIWSKIKGSQRRKRPISG